MSKIAKFILFFIIIIALIGGVFAYIGYKAVFTPNINNNSVGSYFYIPTNANFEQVLDSLIGNNILINKSSFIKTSQIKKYKNNIQSGRYYIEKQYSNNDLINMLRGGWQTPINVTVPSVRSIDKLCQTVSKYFEFSAEELDTLLKNESFISSYNLTDQTIISIFIPNTYQMYWNSSPEKFVERMKQEYDNFWTQERTNKAAAIGLSKIEVSTLASIVQSEQMQHSDERPKIAGLYLNRLQKGMLLQSDPTLVFALGDFTIKRIYDYHKEIESPYNTYKYTGLPPGPILSPEISSIDAVLNPETHNFIYMCAKEDFSGYHYFSTNLSEHNMYARRYHDALNRLNIR
ncbi:MAG: endolytic transglycosylase MltG [Bacteroidales bacterium]|nr:endolytic transglycosylase MltG [Bacteroidales bacterium]